MKELQPAIKWSGSKRPIATEIISTFPKEIDTYYEPFCGGCSVLFSLLHNKEIVISKYICSDINNDLISLWNEVKNNPEAVIQSYTKMWHELSALSIGDRKKYFGMVRERFNKEKSPYDFMFIMRTTTNGMPRYNLSGDFNNSFHVTRRGINPKEFSKIIENWNTLLVKKNVEFISRNYEDIFSSENDVLYLDPPYAGTKGMYYGVIDYNKLWEWISEQNGFVTLSFDGKTTTKEYVNLVPEGLFKNHVLIKSGNSSFRRTIGTSNSEIVYESLYTK